MQLSCIPDRTRLKWHSPPPMRFQQFDFAWLRAFAAFIFVRSHLAPCSAFSPKLSPTVDNYRENLPISGVRERKTPLHSSAFACDGTKMANIYYLPRL